MMRARSRSAPAATLAAALAHFTERRPSTASGLQIDIKRRGSNATSSPPSTPAARASAPGSAPGAWRACAPPPARARYRPRLDGARTCRWSASCPASRQRLPRPGSRARAVERLRCRRDPRRWSRTQLAWWTKRLVEAVSGAGGAIYVWTVNRRAARLERLARARRDRRDHQRPASLLGDRACRGAVAGRVGSGGKGCARSSWSGPWWRRPGRSGATGTGRRRAAFRRRLRARG